MKKIEKLNLNLKELESQKITLKNLENISLSQFLKYKSIIAKELKIEQQIKQKQKLANQANFSYDVKVKNWIDNPHIKCKEYAKLQQKAEYQRDCKLYKLGYLDKKPLSPLLKNLLSHLPENIYLKINALRNFNDKYSSFKSDLLPQHFNKLAIDTAKIGIKGYRKFRSNCKFLRRYINSSVPIKYIKSILEEANAQVNQAETQDMLLSRNITRKGVQFRESLKFTPGKIEISSDTSKNHKNKIPYPTSKRNIILNNPAEYIL